MLVYRAGTVNNFNSSLVKVNIVYLLDYLVPINLYLQNTEILISKIISNLKILIYFYLRSIYMF